MIHSGMRESQVNEMYIENFSLSCVETLLNYFYGYNVNDSIELFQAADFYQLNILKDFWLRSTNAVSLSVQGKNTIL